MEDNEKIRLLEDELVELKFSLKDLKDKESAYKEVLSEIKNSINEIVELEIENERFNLEAEIDYKSCLINLNNYLREYKRLYKLNF